MKHVLNGEMIKLVSDMQERFEVLNLNVEVQYRDERFTNPDWSESEYYQSKRDDIEAEIAKHEWNLYGDSDISMEQQPLEEQSLKKIQKEFSSLNQWYDKKVELGLAQPMLTQRKIDELSDYQKQKENIQQEIKKHEWNLYGDDPVPEDKIPYEKQEIERLKEELSLLEQFYNQRADFGTTFTQEQVQQIQIEQQLINSLKNRTAEYQNAQFVFKNQLEAIEQDISQYTELIAIHGFDYKQRLEELETEKNNLIDYCVENFGEKFLEDIKMTLNGEDMEEQTLDDGPVFK
jgi:hypothetical protein